MQTIPQTYRRPGHTMQLQKREGMAAMFRSVSGNYWEVHRIRVSPPKEMFGRAYPEREVLAGNEAFGEFGWACTSQDRADARFSEALAADAISGGDV